MNKEYKAALIKYNHGYPQKNPADFLPAGFHAFCQLLLKKHTQSLSGQVVFKTYPKLMRTIINIIAVKV